MRILVFGTFDLFHFGHLELLRRASELGDYLIVGVSTDYFVYHKKKEFSISSLNDRKAIVRAIRYVDEVVDETDFNCQLDLIKRHNVDIVVWGDDWDNGTFDYLKEYVKVVFLPRTPNISTSLIRKNVSG